MEGLSFHDFSIGGQPTSTSDYTDMLNDNTVDDRSVFANATWHVLSNLDVQGGIRLAWQTGTNKWEMPLGAYRTFLTPAAGGGLGYGPGPLFQGGAVEQTQKPYTSGMVATPMATASYHFTPDAMAFVRYAQGYTAGSTTYNAALGQNITLTPEVVHDYEAGFRTEWLNHRLQANVTGYYMEWDGRPIQTSYFSPTTQNFVFATTSGGKSRADGFEFTFLALPVQGLTVAMERRHAHDEVDHLRLRQCHADDALGLCAEMDVPFCSPVRLRTAQQLRYHVACRLWLCRQPSARR